MATALGYKAVVKSSGTSTAFTDEAATLVTSTTATYQITSTSKRVWDRTATITAKDGSTAATVSSVDYLQGTVTLSEAASGDVTIGGKYLPMTDVAGAHQFALNLGGDLVESTDFAGAVDNGGYKTRTQLLQDVSATLTRFDDLEGTFRTILAARTPVVVEIQPDTGLTFRAFMVIESDNSSGDMSALESEEISFQLDGDPDDATNSFTLIENS